MNDKYFLSFIEEMVMNPKYFGYIGGRVEVHYPNSDNPYADEEIRFFTKDQDGFCAFREKWDFIRISVSELEYVKKQIKDRFCDEV